MELVGSTEAVARAEALLQAFRKAGRPIVHVQHLATRAGATFFLPGTQGAELHVAVTPLPGEPVLRKHFPNAFRNTPLHEHLRRLDLTQLVIAGMMTHMCIDTTVRAAFDLGFQCQLAGDACATKNLSRNGVTVSAEQVQVAFLAALDGTFATVRTVNEICAGL
jgi:nicotinamidase-related amidase